MIESSNDVITRSSGTWHRYHTFIFRYLSYTAVVLANRSELFFFPIGKCWHLPFQRHGGLEREREEEWYPKGKKTCRGRPSTSAVWLMTHISYLSTSKLTIRIRRSRTSCLWNETLGWSGRVGCCWGELVSTEVKLGWWAWTRKRGGTFYSLTLPPEATQQFAAAHLLALFSASLDIIFILFSFLSYYEYM